MENTPVRKKRKYTHEEKSLVILKSTLSRLPIYYCYLQEKIREGVDFISSTDIAKNLSLNTVQVRKDLASVSTVPGRPKRGFRTERLLADMKTYLGYDNQDEAVLVGVGGLGSTLMQYSGFGHYGLSIVAGFDTRSSLHNKSVGGRTIYPMDKFEDLVRRLNITVGIITVPAPQAQKVADMMMACGIRAIWNFAPTHINIPRGVLIKNENLAASLAVLVNELNKKVNAEKKAQSKSKSAK